MVQAGIADARIYNKRARACVVEALGCSDGEADRYIRRVVANLRETDFCRTVQLKQGGELADEYGVKNEEGSWYVKVFVLDGTHVVSCHRPERPMTTASGMRIS